MLTSKVTLSRSSIPRASAFRSFHGLIMCSFFKDAGNGETPLRPKCTSKCVTTTPSKTTMMSAKRISRANIKGYTKAFKSTYIFYYS